MTAKSHIHIAKLDDGTFLAVSIDTPRFCVTGETKAEALRKAGAARAYFDDNKHKALGFVVEDARIVRPVFEPQEVNC